MSRIVIALMLLSLSLNPVSALAQDKDVSAPEAQALPDGVTAEDLKSPLNCFDYYTFGSVQADLQPTVSTTVPGATLTFTGNIKSENPYPLLDGTLYVKIFRRNDTTFSAGDGNEVVDQFVIKEGITMPAQSSVPVKYEWRVPQNAEGGEYYAAYFFTTAKRYNLMGLSFTDDVVGNQAAFSVASDKVSVKLSKVETTINGQNHHFAAFPLHFKADDTVTVKTTVTNPTSEAKTIPLQWNQYAWDAMNPSNLRHTKTEAVTLAPNETKEVVYEVRQQGEGVVYLTAVTQDLEAKSILNVRYVRDGIEETRINFPGLTTFPLKAGEAQTLYACAHAINEPIVLGNTLTLSLKDREGNVIHEYKYEGIITGGMSGFGENFTPDKDVDYAVLVATLERNGKVVEQVTQTYDCSLIDPTSCSPKAIADVSFFDLIKDYLKYIVALFVIILLLVIGMIIFQRRKTIEDVVPPGMTTPMAMLLLVLLPLTFLILTPTQAEAKSVSWNQMITNNTYEAFLGCDLLLSGECASYSSYFKNPNVTITYNATIKDNSTNTSISDGATVPVGSCIKVTNSTFSSSDISWFASPISSLPGGIEIDTNLFDSPNGYWISGAAEPSVACLAADYVGIQEHGYGGQKELYSPLSINPPTVTIDTTGSTAGLTDQGNGVYCVNSAGSIKFNSSYAATAGKFYLRHNEISPIYTQSGCTNTNGAMASGAPWSLYGGTPAPARFSLDVPQQSISFNLTAVSNNNPPATPTIAGSATGVTGTGYDFTLTSTDPDGDTLRYGISDASCVAVSEWLPGSGYTTSGTSQIKNQSWSAAGTYIIYVLAEDSNGGRSSCAQHTITVSAAPVATADLKINGSDGPVNLTGTSDLTVSWVGTSAASCTLYGSGLPGGSVALTGSTNATISATDTYVLTCGSASDSVQVNVVPPPPPPANFVPPTFSDISYSGLDAGTGTYATMTANMRVLNNGSDTTVSAPYEVTLDGVVKATGNIPPLVQNGYVDIAIAISGPISVGAHVLVGEADKGDVVSESDETDNVGTYNITVPPADPGLSITVNPIRVQNGKTAILDWTASSPYSMSCSIFGPGLVTRNFDLASATAADHNLSAGPITAKSVYTISCAAGSATFTDTVTVETQGVIEEI